MKKILIHTVCKKMLADVYTPVGIYLRLRDRFRDTVLLESTDHHATENSWSFMGVQAIGGIEVKNMQMLEYKYPGQPPVKEVITRDKPIAAFINTYLQRYETSGDKTVPAAQSLFGYTAYDAVRFFEDLTPVPSPPLVERGASVKHVSNNAAAGSKESNLQNNLQSSGSSNPLPQSNQQSSNTVNPPSENNQPDSTKAPLSLPGAGRGAGGEVLRYRLYQYVIAINHFKDELYICENEVAGLESEIDIIESLIRSRNVPEYPFAIKGEETSNMTNADYMQMVEKGKAACHRGDVFQIVLSRRFQQGFTGDEFNVYRALRSINPSPYLFYFDYGDYRLFGSSPESQLVIKNSKVTVHPIAGTFKRTGDDAQDEALAEKLLLDPKENAEHVMLVDLARNDLSRHAENVTVSSYRKVHYYSHVIHLVSEVTGQIAGDTNPYDVFAATFPAGTLSGAPKVRAMQLINQWEPTPRGYYGGAIGLLGLDGSFNHAIMIRTFLSRNNTLHYQAGAGITVNSVPETELTEVANKLGALKKAIGLAEEISR